MTTATLKAMKKNLASADHVKELDKMRLESVHLEDMFLTRIWLEPGWKWSQHVQPTAGTPSCQCPHAQYVVSGRLSVAMDDGTQMELVPGDFAIIPPGHDAHVVGDEPFVAIDFSAEMKQYMK
jgi:quercetin dioxygenase-like cupin family protein